jgi:hypothetical protein
VSGTITFSEFVTSFLDEYLVSGKLNNFSVFVCRQDGHLIYNRDHMDMGVEHSSVGALLSGVWQAATTLASFIPQDEKRDIFRLSFDTSSHGIYILPFEQGEEQYSLGLLYKNEVNPGFLKSRLRDLLMKMTIEMSNLKLKEIKTNKDFLFNDITDEEMDRVFTIRGADTCHS